MQQAVTETQALVEEMEEPVAILQNGDQEPEVEPAPMAEAAPAAPAPAVPTYDQQFPSLGGGPTPENKSANPIGRWNTKPTLRSSTVTQVFHIPAEERKDADGGFGSSDSHKKLDAIMNNSGARIEMSSSKDKSLTFLITAKPDQVLRAKREILVHFQTQANITINIPKEHHRFLLGKGGSKLQDLERATATKITIPKANEQSDCITVAGNKDGIEKALHELRIVSDEQSKQAYERLEIPKIYHPFIQGPNQENTNRMIADNPGVRINIPPLSVMKDEMSIAGEKEGVLAVKAEIVELWKGLEKKCSTISVEVKKSQHKYVIGPRGSAINEILADTGVFVEMPPNEGNSESITLRGPQEKLGLALTKVYERANSVASVNIPCPSWLHRYIIGKKGSGIQKITADLNLDRVHVEFCDDDSIKVEGPPEDVEKAKVEITAQAKVLIDDTGYAELSVDAKYHKHIIGKGGSTVNRLKDETGCAINIPDSDTGITIIRIEGNKAGVEMAKAELTAMVEKMENEKEKDLIIENRFHRQLIGPKGESIQKIRDEYSAVQISFPDLGVKSDIVKLRGPKTDVDACSKYLTKQVKDLQECNYQVKVPIYKQFHKFIIGKGGMNIRKIRDETETRIDLPDSGSDSDMITITGKKENVAKAQHSLEEIQSQMANIVSKDIMVPAKIHNTMIGAGGKLIQSIMTECGGVAIKFPTSGSGSDKVTIRGPSEEVEKAVKLLMELADEKTLSGVTEEVKAKPEHHKFLIGRQGIHIQKIRDQTGARIIFPGSNDTDRESITIIGTKESVALAKVELEARIKDLDNIVEDSMTVDPKHHRHFVARRGEILRKIGDEFGGVVVSFPRNGVASDKVNLKGARDCIDGAKARMEEIVKDLEDMITMDCEIEQTFHRTVMGAKGSKVQKITTDFNVQIKFPDKAPQAGENGEVVVNGGGEKREGEVARSSNPNIIRVHGKSANCEAACDALKALVPITSECEVSYEFHRFIIGQKGCGVRQMMNEFDVNIKVPSAEAKSDIILISGAPSNVEEAKAAMEVRVKELEEEKKDKELASFKIEMTVNPEYHPKIIGRRGAVITELRQKYKVNIQLPNKRSNEEVAWNSVNEDNTQGAEHEGIITITGLEANVYAAKEEIGKIVGDYENMVKEEVSIDPRVHSMIIGKRGRSIRQIMEDYKVDIRLPRDGDADPSLVVISGDEDNVMDCKDHLKMLEEEFIQDAADREWMTQYEKPNRAVDNKETGKKPGGFVVSKAPWDVSSSEAFPSLGGGPSSGPASSAPPAWGPMRSKR